MRSRGNLGTRLLLAVTLAVTAATWLGSCKQDEQATSAATYTVRGEIQTLPTPGRSEALFLHHEAIPTFVTHDGKQSGMMSMTMGFGVGPEVSLDGLAQGDKVEFTFSVDWERNPTTQITSIRKLPADTKLELTGM